MLSFSGKPEDFRFCVAEGSNQSSLFELRPDRVKNYDFTLRRLDSEALRLLQRWGRPDRNPQTGRTKPPAWLGIAESVN